MRIKTLVHKIKNMDGAAAASIKSWDAKLYAFIEKVSKLKGLKMSVIGSSFIISIDISIKIKSIFFFIMGQWIFENVFNLLNPIR